MKSEIHTIVHIIISEGPFERSGGGDGAAAFRVKFVTLGTKLEPGMGGTGAETVKNKMK